MSKLSRHRKLVLSAAAFSSMAGIQVASGANTQNNFTTGTNLVTGTWSLGHTPTATEDATLAIGAPTGTLSLNATSWGLGSLNIVNNSSTLTTIQHTLNSATDSVLTLGASSTGNSVAGSNAADLIYLGGLGDLTLSGTNSAGGTGVVKTILGAAGNFNVVSGRNLTLGGSISGSFGFTKVGAGNVSLGASNSFVGNVTVLGGNVRVGADTHLGGASNSVLLNGGGLAITGAGATIGSASSHAISVGALGGTLSVASGVFNTGTIASNITGSGAGNLNLFAGDPIGVLTLSGTNTYDGGSTITANTVRFSTAASLPSAGQVTINSGGTLAVTGAFTTVASTLSGGKIASGSTGSLGIVANNAENLNFSGYNNLQLTVAHTGTSTVSYTYGGVITPAANTFRVGGGYSADTLTFNTANTFAGAGNEMVINSGALFVYSASNSFAGGTTLNSGALIELQNENGLGAGLVTLAGGSTLRTNFASAANLGNSLRGAGSLTKTGTSTLTVSGNNSFAGGTTISAGRLIVGNANALGAAWGGLSLSAATSSLDLNGNSVSVGSLSSGNASAQIINNASSTNVTLTSGRGNPSSSTFTGVIANNTAGTGTVALKKMGTTTLTLSNNNTYSGGTTLVDGGGLTANLSASGTPFGTGTVNHLGGTLTLSPTGSGSAIVYSGPSDTSGNVFNYGGGSILALTKGTQTSVTYTVGGGGTAQIARSGQGTLIIKPSAAGNLGSSEFFKVNGTTPAVTNGMVNPTIAGLGVNTSGQFDFLTYTANGFVPATYSNNLTTTQTYGTTLNATVASTPAASQIVTIQQGAGNAQALIVNPAGAGGSTRISGVVNIGNDTTGQQAGVILNAAVTSVSGGMINFGKSEGIVWNKQTYGSSLGVGFAGTGGVTFVGDNGGPANLPSNNTFSGGITLSSGTFNGSDVPANLDAMFGDPSNTVTFNGAVINSNLQGQPFGTNRSLVVAAAGVTFQSDNHFFHYGGNINATGIVNMTVGTPTQTTAGGTLTGSNTFAGGISLGGGGLPWRVSSEANLGGPTSPIVFSGGMLGIMGLQTGGGQLTSFGSHPVTFQAGVGLDIQNPNTTFTVSQSMNMGNNAFTKYGPGTVVLTGANSYTGGTVLYGGTVRLDAANGGSLAATAPTFAGGTLHLLGKASGPTSTTLGNVTIGQAGGTLLVDTNTSSGTYTLALGTLATSTTGGAALNIVTDTHGGGTATITTTSNKDLTTGIYSGRVTFNGADWTTTNSTSGPFVLSALPSSSYTDVTSPSGTDTNNSRITNSQSIGGAWTTNTLKVTNNTAGQTLTLGGTTTLTSGGLLFSAPNDQTISGGTIASGIGSNATNTDLIVHVNGGEAGKLTINSTIAGTGTATLTKAGTGTLYLGSANTYTGSTFINGGTLSVSAINQLGATASSAVHVNGGTLQITGASNFSYSTTHNLYFGSANANAGNNGGGAGTLDITNGGTVTVTGNVSGGAVTVKSSDTSGGTLVMGSTGASQLNDGLTINDNAVVRLGGTKNFNSFSFGEISTYVTLNDSSKLQLAGNSAAIAGLVSSSSSTIVGNAYDGTNRTATTLTVSVGENQTFAGRLMDNTNGAAGTGKMTVIKDGAGTWTLSNTGSTYTGTTTIYNGAISVTSLGNAGSNGSLGAAANGAGISAPIQLGFGASTGVLNYVGAGENSNRNINLAGLSGGATIDASGTTSSGSPFRLSGAISATTSLGTAVADAANKTLTLTGGGYGQIDGAIPDATVTSFNSQTGSGKTALTKSGGGTWVMTGANTYTGPTSVNAGTLRVNGSLGASAVTVANGATFGGSGTINGSVTIQSGGHLAIGSSPGTQVYNGGLSLTSGSNFDWEHTAGNAVGSAGTDFDLASVTGGNITIASGAKLNLFFSASTSFSDTFWNSAQQWKIVDNTGAGTVSGNYSNSDLSVFVNNAITGSANTITGQGSFTTTTTGDDVYLNWTALATNQLGLTSGANGTGLTDRGDVVTAGSNGSYATTTIHDDSNGNDGQSSGFVDITGSYPTPSGDAPAYVLLDFNTNVGLDAFLATVAPGYDTASFTFSTANAGNTSLFNELASAYAGANRTWDALIRIDGLPLGSSASNLDFNWTFEPSSGFAIDKIAVVPEPSSLGLAAIGAMGLISRRRRKA